MSKYLILLYGGHDSMSRLSPEEAQAHMGEWRTWMGDLLKEGLLIGGNPLTREGRVLKGQEGTVVKDGPYAETKEAVAGYVMINANSLDHAAEISRGCPGLKVGTDVEVRPIAEM